MKATYAAYAEWTRNYHYPDGPMVSYLDAFKGGIEYARRTPPPATRELVERFKLYIDDLDPDGTDLTWFEIGVEVQYMKRFLAEWPGPVKEES